MKRLIQMTILALVTAVSALFVGSTAEASPFIRYGVQDDAFLAPGPSAEARIATLDRLGVKLVRYTVHWRQVARRKPARAVNPDDPAYDWAATDAVLRALREHRIGVLVTLYGTPAWANGGRSANVVPTSKYSLAAFARAVARRYPWIRMWEVWNEPNLRVSLKPNSPAFYVHRLLNPTYAALHAVRRSNRVAGGATSPRPTPSGKSPVAFMRGMRKAHARLDAYAHHPYPVTRGETPRGFARGVCRYCKGILTLANLPVLLREVRRDFGRKRIWLTEYGHQTRPPNRRLGVSRGAQARFVSEAALRAKSARYVDVLIHFIVKDDPTPAGWQSGLLTPSGTRKPAFYAYMLPLAQISRHRLRTTLWGQVRPRSGRQLYRLQRRAHGRWVSVGPYRLTNARGSFRRVVRAGRRTVFRVYSPADKATSRVLVVR